MRSVKLTWTGEHAWRPLWTLCKKKCFWAITDKHRDWEKAVVERITEITTQHTRLSLFPSGVNDTSVARGPLWWPSVHSEPHHLVCSVIKTAEEQWCAPVDLLHWLQITDGRKKLAQEGDNPAGTPKHQLVPAPHRQKHKVYIKLNGIPLGGFWLLMKQVEQLKRHHLASSAQISWTLVTICGLMDQESFRETPHSCPPHDISSQISRHVKKKKAQVEWFRSRQIQQHELASSRKSVSFSKPVVSASPPGILHASAVCAVWDSPGVPAASAKKKKEKPKLAARLRRALHTKRD